MDFGIVFCNESRLTSTDIGVGKQASWIGGIYRMCIFR